MAMAWRAGGAAEGCKALPHHGLGPRAGQAASIGRVARRSAAVPHACRRSLRQGCYTLSVCTCCYRPSPLILPRFAPTSPPSTLLRQPPPHAREYGSSAMICEPMC